jgi:hypothetical protein
MGQDSLIKGLSNYLTNNCNSFILWIYPPEYIWIHLRGLVWPKSRFQWTSPEFWKFKTIWLDLNISLRKRWTTSVLVGWPRPSHRASPTGACCPQWTGEPGTSRRGGDGRFRWPTVRGRGARGQGGSRCRGGHFVVAGRSKLTISGCPRRRMPARWMLVSGRWVGGVRFWSRCRGGRDSGRCRGVVSHPREWPEEASNGRAPGGRWLAVKKEMMPSGGATLSGSFRRRQHTLADLGGWWWRPGVDQWRMTNDSTD